MAIGLPDVHSTLQNINVAINDLQNVLQPVGISVGVTPISSGTNGYILYDNNGLLGEAAVLPAVVQVGVNNLNAGANAFPYTFWAGDATWKKPLGWYNVTHYANIAAAYAACAGGGGGVLYFPKGTYVGATLTVNTANIIIMGDGPGGTTAALGTDLQFSVVIAANGCGIENIRISGTVGYGLTFTTGICWFRNIVISGCTGGGIDFSGSNTILGNSVIVQNCTGHGFNLNPAVNIQITNFQILQSGDDGIYINGNGSQGNIFIAGEVFQSTLFDVILDSVPAGAASSDNKFMSVYFDSGVNGSAILNGSNNSFTNCWWSSGKIGAGHSGMNVSGGTGARFSNCEFFANGREGLLLSGTSQFTVVSNCTFANNSMVAANTYSGIFVAAGVTFFSIMNNNCTNGIAAGFGTQKYGIELQAGATDFYSVIGNLVSGNGTGGIFDGIGPGANHIVIYNF